MCDVLLPPGVNPTAVIYIYIYNIIYLLYTLCLFISKNPRNEHRFLFTCTKLTDLYLYWGRFVWCEVDMDTVRTIKAHFSLQRTNLQLTCMTVFVLFLLLFCKVIICIRRCKSFGNYMAL
jgi:hypothetical protein